MPVTEIAIEEDTPFDFTLVRVYTSPSLLNFNWTEQPWLRVTKLSMVAGPDIDQASLEMQVGLFSCRTDSPFELPEPFSGIVEPLKTDTNGFDIDRQYVKIELLDAGGEVDRIWVGRLAYEEQDVMIRTVTDPDDEEATLSVKTGTQRFVAYGLLWEWENTFIESSFVLREEGTDDVIEPERGIPFNYVDRAGGYTIRGNKDETSTGEPVFSWLPFSSNQWNADEAIKYLTHFHLPETPAGNTAVAIDMTGATLDYYDISVQTDRRSVKAILDELVDRRRLAGYYLKPQEIGGSVFCDLILFTFTTDDIVVGDDTIPQNPNQIALECRSTALSANVAWRSVSTHVADRIIVEGAPITSTFSCTFGEGVFKAGWSGGQESSFKAGAGGDDEDLNTAARSTDSLKDVFSRYVVDEAWTQRLDGDVAVTIQPEDIPDDVDNAEIVTLFTDPAVSNPWRHVAARFLDYIAMKDEETNEFRRPFVIFPEPQIDGNKWVYADQASIGERQFACNLHMLKDRLGIVLTANKSGGQSLLAREHFDNANATPDELDPANEDNWAFEYEDLIFTGTVEWDDRVSAGVTLTATGDAASRVRRIMVDDARLDILIPGTITDIDDNGETIVSTGEVLRDDRARLRTIASAAAQWYGTPRNAITVNYSSPKQFVEIGQIVTTITDGTVTEDVNTPITGIAIDFEKGVTIIETSYAEADFASNRAGVGIA